MQEKYERQMKKGVLDMLVLQLLTAEKKYGYQLIMELREKAGDIFGLKEGTLYPILYRLEEEELVESRWFEAENKQIPRKYYLMTDKGQQTLAEMYQSWRQIAEGVERLMNREKNEEAGKDNWNGCREICKENCQESEMHRSEEEGNRRLAVV